MVRREKEKLLHIMRYGVCIRGTVVHQCYCMMITNHAGRAPALCATWHDGGHHGIIRVAVEPLLMPAV